MANLNLDAILGKRPADGIDNIKAPPAKLLRPTRSPSTTKRRQEEAADERPQVGVYTVDPTTPSRKRYCPSRRRHWARARDLYEVESERSSTDDETDYGRSRASVAVKNVSLPTPPHSGPSNSTNVSLASLVSFEGIDDLINEAIDGVLDDGGDHDIWGNQEHETFVEGAEIHKEAQKQKIAGTQDQSCSADQESLCSNELLRDGIVMGAIGKNLEALVVEQDAVDPECINGDGQVDRESESGQDFIAASDHDNLERVESVSPARFVEQAGSSHCEGNGAGNISPIETVNVASSTSLASSTVTAGALVAEMITNHAQVQATSVIPTNPVNLQPPGVEGDIMVGLLCTKTSLRQDSHMYAGNDVGQPMSQQEAQDIVNLSNVNNHTATVTPSQSSGPSKFTVTQGFKTDQASQQVLPMRLSNIGYEIPEGCPPYVVRRDPSVSTESGAWNRLPRKSRAAGICVGDVVNVVLEDCSGQGIVVEIRQGNAFHLMIQWLYSREEALNYCKHGSWHASWEQKLQNRWPQGVARVMSTHYQIVTLEHIDGRAVQADKAQLGLHYFDFQPPQLHELQQSTNNTLRPNQYRDGNVSLRDTIVPKEKNIGMAPLRLRSSTYETRSKSRRVS